MKSEREQIENAIAAGDRAVCGELFKLYGKRIYSFCFRMLESESDAEDAVSDTFVSAIECGHQLSAKEAIVTWLFRIAQRFCLERLRERRMQRKLFQGYDDEPEPAVDIVLRLALAEAISGLPQGYRDAFVLCEIENLPIEEAAVLAGCKYGALSVRLTRARRMLQKMLGGSD